MIEIFDRARRKVAILENAHKISEQQRINAVWHLSFSLPWNDPKNEFCQPFWYVRRDEEQLYRIMPSAMEVDETGAVSYQCEHVLATLIDDVLFGYHVVGNLGVYTADSIRYILNYQVTKNWVLDACDFHNQFEYGWEQESLLSALFSIANPLTGPYMWVTNTSIYPWRLSLRRLSVVGSPEIYVRRKYNMGIFHKGIDPQQIVTRLYPLGYGEGVNQLGIAPVNGGVPYLQSPKSVTDKYGLIQRVWIDRRYEDPESLKAAAQAMLDRLQEPLISYEIGFQEMGQSDFDRAAVGKRVRVVFPEAGEQVDTFITEVNRNYEDVTRSSIVVANRETSIASSLADMADRQRIEQTYAQGATQIYSQALQANCDAGSGAIMDFFIPEEMRIINKILVKIRMAKFRAYSKSTENDDLKVITSTTTDDQTRTSSDGGRTTQTTSTTDNQTRTSSDGGGSVTASSGGGGIITDTGPGGINVTRGDRDTSTVEGHHHTVSIVTAHQHQITLWNHTHNVTMPTHSHTTTIPGHFHSVTIPDHRHTITIPGHSHKVTIPAHAHSITPGIYQYGNPQRFELYVNGAKKAEFSGRTAELDITNLLTAANNMIPRGSWLSLEIRPDDLAYISIDLIVQGFIQSRGDKTV